MSETVGKKLWLATVMLILFSSFCLSFVKSRHSNKNATMKPKSAFSCAVNCMDGRVQDAVKNYIIENYRVDYVDVITEPGPNKILADNSDRAVVEDIKKRLEISVHHHGAKVVALVGHFGCAGNPAGKEEQIEHLKKAKKTIKSFGLNVEIILLWVGEDWQKAELIN